MEPQTTNQVTQQLTKVTPLSKALAAILFIVLPFVGLYIGYTFAPEKVVEVTVAPTPQEAAESVQVNVDAVLSESVDSATSLEGLFSYDEIKADDEAEYVVNDNTHYISIAESSDIQAGFSQYNFTMYKKVQGDSGVTNYKYVLGTKDLPEGMSMFKPTWLSQSDTILAISLIGCWRCGGSLYAPVVVVDLNSKTQPLQTIEIGEVVDFEWVSDRSFRYKNLPGFERITDASLCGMGGCPIEAYDLTSVAWQTESI